MFASLIFPAGTSCPQPEITKTGIVKPGEILKLSYLEAPPVCNFSMT